MNKKIIAIDPSGNGTTGLFYAELNKDLVCTAVDWTSSNANVEKDINNFICSSIGSFVWRNNDKVYSSADIYIVIEDYKDRGITRDNTTSKLINQIKNDVTTWCNEMHKNLVEIKLQQPSNKAMITNDYLIKNNLISKGWSNKINLKSSFEENTTRHVLDALRHWIYYCNKKFFDKKINFEKVFKKLFINEKQ